MKNNLRILLASLAAALFSLSSASASQVALEGAEPGEWTMDYDAALALAEEENLPLLLNFTGSDWCGWCKLMDGQVFAEEEWQDWAADNLVLVTIDFPSDESIVPEKYKARNDELSETFGVQGYPTYILLASDGETMIDQLGAGQDKTPESFIEEVETSLMMSPSNLEAKVEELGPEKGAELQAAINARAEGIEKLETWIATEPVRNPENEKKFEAFLKTITEADEKIKSFF